MRAAVLAGRAGGPDRTSVSEAVQAALDELRARGWTIRSSGEITLEDVERFRKEAKRADG